MSNVVGVRFILSDKVQYCEDQDLNLGIGDQVIVESDEGIIKGGTVVIASGQVIFSELRGPLYQVLRKAESDLA